MAGAPLAELIVYACPHGPLAASIDRYLEAVRHECGPNDAHRFPPHVTLTGFFHDDIWAVRDQVAALGEAVEAAGPSPAPPARVEGLRCEPGFHFLAVRSPWFESVAAAFRDRSPAATRVDAVRPKHDLHLSLAYGFDPATQEVLSALARRHVDPDGACEWTVRLYERMAPDRWVPHGAWPCATIGR